MTRAAALAFAAGVVVAASAHADPATPDQRWHAPLMFGFGGSLTGNDLGSSASLQLDIAPKPWWYVSATAGIGQASAFVGGAGLHLRWVLGGVALSAGAGMLYEGVRDGSDTSEFFGTETTVYHYPAITWATAETAFTARGAGGLELELAAGVAHPLARAAYTCTSTSFGDQDDESETYDCGGTVSGAAPYVAIRINFPLIPSW